jgi:hypothetical protein
MNNRKQEKVLNFLLLLKVISIDIVQHLDEVKGNVLKNDGVDVDDIIKNSDELPAAAVVDKKSIEVINKYGDDAVKAIEKGIDPDLINKLDDVGIPPSSYEKYGIKSPEIAQKVIDFIRIAIKKFTLHIKVKNIVVKNADKVNEWWKTVRGYTNPPYTPDTIVLEVQLKESTTFVRVYDDVNLYQKGGWIMKKEDILGLTAEQIKDKYALPTLPKYITDVNIPLNTKLRIGEANSLDGWGNGGGTQIVVESILIESFIIIWYYISKVEKTNIHILIIKH